MAIIKFGPTVVGVRGTIGGIVFSANKSTPYAKGWSKGSNPRTPLQTAQRSRLSSLPNSWRALSASEQADWDTFAALSAQDLINSLGVTYSISGFGWYVKINARLLAMGRAIRTPVPTQARPAAPTITDLEFPFDTAQTAFVTYASAEFDPDFDLVLEIAQASSTGRIAPPTVFAEFIVDQNPNDTDTGFTTPYVNRLGLGNNTLKGFARLYRQTTDGLRSSAGAASFIADDAPNYAPGALAYDGAADFALRGADLTGNSNGKLWSEVGWFKIDGGAGSSRIIRSSTSNRWQVTIDTANRVAFRAEDTGSNVVVNVRSATTFAADSTWHSYAFSVDTAAQTATLAIDDIPETPSVNTITLDATIDFVVADHSVGAAVGGADKWDGCLSSIWAANDIALDFTDVAIRRSFIGRTGLPLSLGPAGQLPTGDAPILYFPDGDASNNAGTGGNFTNQAGSAACSDSP